MLFHFGTDNYVPIVGKRPKYGIALFVQRLLSRPNPENDPEDERAEERFYNSLVQNLKRYEDPYNSDQIREDQFCELMRTFNTQNSYEFTDED